MKQKIYILRIKAQHLPAPSEKFCVCVSCGCFGSYRYYY